MKTRIYFWALLALALASCREVSQGVPKHESEGKEPKEAETVDGNSAETEWVDGVSDHGGPVDPVAADSLALAGLAQLPDTAFVRLADYRDGFSFDMRYATADNFLKEAVYDCGECYVRANTARGLVAANAEFRAMGHRIRFFDCYRPNSVSHAMWAILPNPQYVANPVKGSVHNRGGAVDITLETLDGQVLDMGTIFDFFGPEAHHDYLELGKEVLENREYLKTVMERHGFSAIRTEWWHYNFRAASRAPIADFRWPCPTQEGAD